MDSLTAINSGAASIAAPSLSATRPETKIAIAPVSSAASPSGDLTEREEQIVKELAQRDREVRAHEKAHKDVGGKYAGPITYEFTRGPDGRQYAVGGEVPIDTAPEEDPEETVDKMQVVIAAALAPAEPSVQDRAVAQLARAQLIDALAEIRSGRIEKQVEGLSSFREGLKVEPQDNSIRIDDAAVRAIEAYTRFRDDAVVSGAQFAFIA